MDGFNDIVIKLNSQGDYIPEEITIKQADVKGRNVKVYITDAGDARKPLNIDVFLAWNNKEHQGVVKLEKLDEFTYSAPITTEMCSRKGNIHCAIQMRDKAGNWLFESRSFNIYCAGSPIEPKVAYESDSFKAYLDASTDISSLSEEMKNLIKQAKADLEKNAAEQKKKLENTLAELQVDWAAELMLQGSKADKFLEEKNKAFNQTLQEHDKITKEKEAKLDQLIQNYQEAQPLTKALADGFYQEKGDYATHLDIEGAIKDLIGTAPAELDTLGEIAEKLKASGSMVSGLVSTVSLKADRTELADYSTKRDTDTKLKNYATKQELSTALTKTQPKGDYLTNTEAANRYQPRGSYITQHTADGRYLAKSSASGTAGAFMQNNFYTLKLGGLKVYAGVAAANVGKIDFPERFDSGHTDPIVILSGYNGGTGSEVAAQLTYITPNGFTYRVHEYKNGGASSWIYWLAIGKV